MDKFETKDGIYVPQYRSLVRPGDTVRDNCSDAVRNDAVFVELYTSNRQKLIDWCIQCRGYIMRIGGHEVRMYIEAVTDTPLVRVHAYCDMFWFKVDHEAFDYQYDNFAKRILQEEYDKQAFITEYENKND